jgi:hypothetical protein
MIEKLTEDNFILHAMHHYDNPGCHSVREFEDDIRRFLYLKKLFNRFTYENDLKERLILNHIIVLYNIFGNASTDMLFFKIEKEHWPALKTFLLYLGRIDEENVDIPLDTKVVDALRKI